MHLPRLRALQMLDGQFGRKPDPAAARALEALVQDATPLRAFSMPGNLLNMIAAAVAQQFDLGGPALSVDAACSSALVATHQAVLNLRARQIDVAGAGGGYLNLLPDNLGRLSRIGALTAHGSVKANIGHTVPAAGIAGLIKASLALHHRTLPPQPSVTEQNPKLGLGDGPFFLPPSAMAWETPDGHPRRAAVSSFGFGGTNAHLVLEEAPRAERQLARRSPAGRRRAELILVAASR